MSQSRESEVREHAVAVSANEDVLVLNILVDESIRVQELDGEDEVHKVELRRGD